ncbi:SAM-dependent methyltransferase [Streptomyces sp. 8L]|uniref:SAM-dependent methyltransferase n=1 Tax=Streptomyces sp. 8L TaxID=2877242 RepID=UPI001CD768FA|nr:SAM-dependent methyltransferase [Streptomyces sp. 8L]MCA1223348.1 nodulation S family protein [Streptomyces sp. 8L]
MSTPVGYFDAMYASAEDPWDLAGRWYERRKYALTVASLPRARYRSAFEPGCSVGVLTALLAERCDRLLAADRVASAVATTAARVRDLPHVTARALAVPEQWPDETFDLIVLSELLYYFDDATREALLARTVKSLEPGGTLVTVHWDHPVPEHHRTGSQLAGPLTATPGLARLTDVVDSDFRLQVFARTGGGAGTDAPSPAVLEGLV